MVPCLTLFDSLSNGVNRKNKISSGIDGFACGEPWNRLKTKVHSLQTFKP